jgi:hypothetical protein
LGVHPVAVELTQIQTRVYNIREQYKTKYYNTENKEIGYSLLSSWPAMHRERVTRISKRKTDRGMPDFQVSIWFVSTGWMIDRSEFESQ